MKLDLKNVADNIGVLADEYNLLLVGHNDRYLVFDGDAEEMFADSGIQQMDGEIYKAINWYFDKDTGFIEGCQEHDYLESIVLLQDGIYYVCQVFAESCDGGCGCLDYALAIFNVRVAQENEIQMIKGDNDAWTRRIDESGDSDKNVRLFEDNVSTVRKMRDFINMISSSVALESPIRVRLNEQTYLLRTGFVVEDNVVYIGTDNEVSHSCSLQEIFYFFRAEEATDSWYTPCLVGDDRNRFDKCKVIIRLNGNHYKITKALWANVCNNECIYFEVEKM